MTEFLISWAELSWQVLVDSALYFIIGLILAGLVWTVLNEKNLQLLMGKGRVGTVIRAALVGVPLPLCSCSVLPVASQLRQSGLSKGGTVSFLVSTPESSVDSILLTYSLTDPILTVARPVVAFLTATTAGLWENRYDDESAPIPLEAEADCCGCRAEDESSKPILSRFISGLRHAFTVLISDLAPYLLLGYILAGLAAVAFGSPLDWIQGSAYWPYLAAMLVGVPLYVCATSSTPLAAVLLGAGFPPGAILVFLMVGPATNLATLTVTRRILGMPSTIRYLISIILISLLCGLLLDQVYVWLRIAPSYRPMAEGHSLTSIHTVSAVILGLLIVYHTVMGPLRKLIRST